MHRVRWVRHAVIGAALVMGAQVGRAQATPPIGRPAVAGQMVPQADTAVLARRIALKLERVTLKQAVDEVAALGRVRIAYSRTQVPLDHIVSLVVDSITVGDALTVLLRGTGVGVTPSANGWLVLDRIDASASGPVVARAAAFVGSITGAVTDTLTHALVPYVLVKIDETGQSVRGGADGKYAISDVAPGQYHVTARRVGFVAKTRVVTVEDGKVTTLDFVLNQPPTKLDEVVTTALGDQRRYTVGNDVATINVDSLVPTAPVTSIADVLAERVPGLKVVESNGLVGSGQSIRIRGETSLMLSGDPIIIVDGVRTDNTPGNTLAFLPAVPSPSRFNDIDFSQVESINVLRGPAATTEYGPDASNGVIVIKTKRGTSGRALWAASEEEDVSNLPDKFPEYYYGWGHLTDGSRTPVECPLVPFGGRALNNYPPYNTSVSGGTCVQDSVTHFNPLNTANTTIFGTGTTSRQDVGVGGGTETMRYHLGAGVSTNDGMVRLPKVFDRIATTIGYPGSAFKPNSEDQRSINANMALLGKQTDITVTAAYMSTYASTPGGSQLAIPGGLQSRGFPVLDDSAYYYGYGSPGFSGNSWTPLSNLGMESNQRTDRVTVGLVAIYRPWSWLVFSGDAGIDHGSQTLQQENLPQNAVFTSGGLQDSSGFIGVTQGVTDVYSADARAGITLPLTHWARLITSMGGNYADTRQAAILGSAGGVTSTNLTLNEATNPQVSQTSNRSASLGAYLDEQLAIADRFFIDGAARLDGGSGYGSGYSVALDPKANLSYIAIQNSRTVIRLRSALGVDGQQPPNGASLLLYNLNGSGWLNNAPVTATILSDVGNPHLQPERKFELEGGGDAELFGGRISLDFNGYYQDVQHELVTTSLGFDLNQLPYTENVGEVKNSGIELAASATVVKSWPVTWSLSVNVGTNHNKLIKLDPGFQQQLVSNVQRQAAGYPLYGYWARTLTYADANHDGIIDASEIHLSDSSHFVGSSLPTQTAGVSTHLGFFGGQVQIGATFDYSGGYRVFNENAYDPIVGGALYLQEQNVRNSPLWLQARAAAVIGNANCCNTFFEDGTYWRFRELNVTYAVPRQWMQRVHMTNLTVTAAVRNLALWTRFTGPDPEVSSPQFGGVTSNQINNNLRSSGGQAVPLPREFFLRLNVGL